MSTTRKYLLRKLIQLLLLVFPALLFQSCELEPNPTGNKVEVQILNYDGFRIYASFLYASIGKYPLSIPDNNGICRFDNVSFPYNLIIARNSFDNSFLYKNLGINNPVVLITPYFFNTSKYRKIRLNVNFPPIQENKIGLIKFISKDIIDSLNFPSDSTSHGIFIENESYGRMIIRIPLELTSVSGKLIFLEGAGFWDHRILLMDSYEYYGSKDVTLYEGNNNISFSQNEIQTDPPELPVYFNVNYPQQIFNTQVKVYLNFAGYSSGSQMLMTQLNFIAGQHEAMVPVLTDLNCNIKIFSYYNYIGPDRQTPFKSIELEPGESRIITHSMPEITNPSQNGQIMNINDTLRVNDDGERGVYLFQIYAYDPYTETCIVTDRNSIKLNDFELINCIFNSETNYELTVTKLTSFSSIDEYVTMPYIFNSNYNSLAISPMRPFKTAP